MKIIIPMAGRGSRLRPHTLTVPKPLIPIAGKPIVQRLVEDLTDSFPGEVDEVAFIIGDFGKAVEKQLHRIAGGVGAKASVYYQDQPLGPAHAIWCGRESIAGPTIVAFADTLFKADFAFNTNEDGIIWVQKVDDPSSFGVVKIGPDGYIIDFVEKSPDFVSDLAIVGLYYFRDGDLLREQLQYLIDQDMKDKGEFQITSVLDNMKDRGVQFKPARIEEWLDCGNKENVIYTNKRMLDIKKEKEQLVSKTLKQENAIVIPPCYIGENTVIRNSVVGPYVSIGDNCRIENSVISESVIQNHTHMANANLSNSMLGNEVKYRGDKSELSLGDYSERSKS
jgi:glucose-1-phosphate thymidylyltransferase